MIEIVAYVMIAAGIGLIASVLISRASKNETLPAPVFQERIIYRDIPSAQPTQLTPEPKSDFTKAKDWVQKQREEHPYFTTVVAAGIFYVLYRKYGVRLVRFLKQLAAIIRYGIREEKEVK